MTSGSRRDGEMNRLLENAPIEMRAIGQHREESTGTVGREEPADLRKEESARSSKRTKVQTFQSGVFPRPKQRSSRREKLRNATKKSALPSIGCVRGRKGKNSGTGNSFELGEAGLGWWVWERAI